MEVSKPQIIQINEGEVHAHVDRLVKQTVEEMLNGMLDAEADRLCQARRYEHSDQRQGRALVSGLKIENNSITIMLS